MGPAFFKGTNVSPPSLCTGARGFTLVELTVVVAILGILAAIAVSGFQLFMARAYKVTLQHDLKNFVRVQEAYLMDHGRYLGSAGDFVRSGDPPAGPLVSADFPLRLSDDVRVDITSGDGQEAKGPPAFKAAARHARTRTYYEYDFSTGMTSERQE